MKRIATANRAVDLFGAGKDGFKAAVPGVSDPTYLSALFFNHIQEAIVRTIEQAGLVLSDGDYDQFVTALNQTYARLNNAAFTVSPTAPTPAQFDVSTKVATMEALQRASGTKRSVEIVAPGATLNASHVGKVLRYGTAANGAITLPAASDVATGSTFIIYNPTNFKLTLSVAGGGTIGTPTQDSNTFILGNNETLELVSAGTLYLVIGGSGLSYRTGGFNVNAIASGWQRLPSGLIIQWGNGTASASGAQTMTYPLAFPNAALQVLVAPIATGSARSATLFGVSSSNFGFEMWSTTTGTRVAEAVAFYAIGY
ncbi:hypothetical protein EDC30_102209 [Paucimonas lemoignei]|uniref:Putative tail fiber protein gp53-like C-terminal domain-containing protein n=1 Tax=Paucimonas lemoignei TaxID=29443 RepID=A0A4V6NY07_PAULE|nr:hypothetical protein [Paucimonas lemoignei]TCS38470.1 hypothetical protein EDC30_102209 [Paucimonas lemoignei]